MNVRVYGNVDSFFFAKITLLSIGDDLENR